MKREELKDVLQNSYSQEKWIKTLQFLSGSKNLLTISLEPKFVEIKSAKAKEIVVEVVQLGTLKTTDGITLPIFDVTLQNDIKIEYNRVGVNELLKTHILKDAVKGAIVTFHYPIIASNEVKSEWRFSFISKFGSDYFAEAESVETNPKKYTYIFGTSEEHRTALERLYNLEQSRFRLEDFFEAFNVEPVSNNFFKEYKNFYQDFVFQLSNDKNSKAIFEAENTEDVEKDIRNFVKRLLGRLVFLYFLQKKHWLGATSKNYDDGDTNFLFNLFNYNNDSKDNFYQKWLSKLFFNALNTPNRTNDGFELPDGTSVWIPFLNGGLFEENQEPEKHREIQFPPTLFELLFTFFNGYNFTIYENSPEDHTVAVDPEMLGHIFENLLEDNKDKGAFYTPKEIVHYMTQESLIEYLKTHLLHPREAIESLIKNHTTAAFTRDDLKTVEKLIDTVKICDPAIGSGAFPMGLLQEIFALKAVIHYEMGYTVWSPAKIKQDIIQNSIYGVDIEPGAVDIARLRFWLSLVVDEPTPKPLPNLDYKIMQGNSLIESFDGIDLSNLASADEQIIDEQATFNFGDAFTTKVTLFDAVSMEQFQTLMDKYFSPEEWEKKTKEKVDKIAVKKQINNVIEGKIHAKIFKEKEDTESKIKIFERKYSIKKEADLEKLNTKGKEFKEYEILKKRYSEIEGIENELIAFQNTDERPYFLWHLFFADVFDDGGFDIVIGNPPYIQLQKNGGYLADLYKNEAFETFERTGDIYALFYEKGLNVLKQKGILTYITSRQWMRSSYGESLRGLFAKNNPLTLLDLGSGIFESATVDTNILIIQREVNQDSFSVITLENKKEIPYLLRENFSNLKVNQNDAWTILDANQIYIKKQIEKYGTPLKEWDIDVYRGILTGFNDAFIISKDEKNKILSKDEKSIDVIKPLIRGRDLKRFRSEKSDLSIINTHNGYTKNKGKNDFEVVPNVDIDLYPALKEHFDNQLFKDKLEKRQDKGKTMYNLRNCSYVEDFYKEKIAWASVGVTEYCFIEKDTFLLDTNYFLTFRNSNKIDKYLLGVLNSSLIINWVNKEDTPVGTVAYRHYKYNFERIPIPKIEDFRKEIITLITEIILFLKNDETAQINDIVKNDHIASFFEEVIDGCVFELYFEAHMKEKGINIIDDVKKYIDASGLTQDFENISEGEKKQKIWELYKTMSTGDVQVKMTDFVTKSPDILKPIIQA